MRTSKFGKDVIVRFYSVSLWPDGSPDGPYEPFTVSVSFEAAKADRIEPMSAPALSEVFRRAVKIEAREHGFEEGTTFALHEARLIKSTFVPAASAR